MTDTDLKLFDAAELVHPDYEPRASIDERWSAFRDANQWLLPYLGQLADEWIRDTGIRRVGMGALFEQLRWRGAIATRGDRFKANNDFRAPATRDLIALRPDLADVFNTRARRSGDHQAAA
ncbi:MAG: hypothetical protein JWM93_2436 [Frankiales bacterium]|nr:hypothetical protein [Frankiales bacterium]